MLVDEVSAACGPCGLGLVYIVSQTNFRSYFDVLICSQGLSVETLSFKFSAGMFIIYNHPNLAFLQS